MSLIRKFGALTKSDKVLFQFLYQSYCPRANEIAFRITGNRATAEDIAQVAFEKALEAFECFDDVNYFAKWLVVTTTNLAIDEFRKDKRHRKADKVFEDYAAAGYHENNPELRFLKGEEEMNIANEIKALKPMYGLVLHLRYYCDFSFAEIAEKLEISESVARTRCFRALNKLKKKLQPLGEDKEEAQ